MNNSKEEYKKPRQIFFCHSCNMQFSTRKVFEAHKKKQSHIAKEKSQGSKSCNVSGNQKLGIYVRGYSSDTKETDLIKYFSQFGNVIWIHFGRGYLIMDFSEPFAVNKIMAKNAHFLNGKRLIVRYKQGANVKVPVNDEEVNETIYQSIITELNPSSNFQQEFLCMIQKLQPNLNESFKKYNLICHDLYNFLKCRFPEIEVHPFGSTLTGLGFNNSDVDVFLGNVRQQDDEEISRLGNIKKILLQSGRFANCYLIPGAKIPLVKCVHIPTGIKLDINIKNMLGVFNSKLIQYYLSIDPKVKQVILVLKYWGKCHKITGQNHLLTNYSLVLMFIFFLQHPPYNFPSVHSLQQQEFWQYRQYFNIQTCWDGEFVPNYYFQSDKLFSTSPLELMQQFFTFYSQFPFNNDIICPYLGKPLPRSSFQDSSSLPDIFARYKEFMSQDTNEKFALKLDSAVCLQDPFEHCRNTTSVVSECILDSFVLLCQLGKTICQNNERVVFKLLTEKPPSLKKEKVTYQGDNLNIVFNRLSRFTKSLDLVEWFEFVVNFVTMSLRDFLLMDVKLHSQEGSCKKDADTQKRIYVCTGKMNMWHARKSIVKQLNLAIANMTLVDREKAITARLKEVNKNMQDNADILGFKLTVEGKNDEVSIWVERLNLYKKSYAKSFIMFFAANVPHWLETYEKDVVKTKEYLNDT